MAMVCPDCGSALDDVPVGSAGPGCGGQRRDATAAAVPANVLAGAPHPPGQTIYAEVIASSQFVSSVIGVTVTRYGPPGWGERWRKIRDIAAEIEDAYGGRKLGLGNTAVEGLIFYFCGECDHLRDSLKHDDDLPAIGSTLVEGFVKTSPAILRCQDINNTYKHHKRERGATTAWIRMVSMTESWAWARIMFEPCGGTPYELDARHVVRAAVGAWRRFLVMNSIPAD
jgi:hypothetical protein